MRPVQVLKFPALHISPCPKHNKAVKLSNGFRSYINLKSAYTEVDNHTSDRIAHKINSKRVTWEKCLLTT